MLKEATESNGEGHLLPAPASIGVSRGVSMIHCVCI